MKKSVKFHEMRFLTVSGVREMRIQLTLYRAVVILLVCVSVCAPVTQAGDVYATWDSFEVDKLASIWLIQKHISPGAEIRVYPKGEAITEGTPFDVPGAAIQRTFNQSSFESLKVHFNLEDAGLDNMALLIRDVEINTWETKAYQITSEVEVFFVNLIKEHAPPDVLIQESNRYLDELYKTLSGGLEKNHP